MKQHFSLVELLIVIAIIAVLAALLLPALSRAKEYSEMTFCANNMRNIHTYACVFESDMDCFMPAMYYRSHPYGRNDGDPIGAGSLYSSGMHNGSTYFVQMLVDFGYLPAKGRCTQRGFSWTVKEQTFEHYRKNLPEFICPRGTMKGSKRTNLAFGWDYGYRKIGVCPNCGIADAGTVAGEADLWTAYTVNMNAGAFEYYHLYKPNGGYYKVKKWQSAPSEVGYLFEFYGTTWTNSNNFSARYNPAGSAWGTYDPSARHMRKSKNNFIFADGHRGVLGDSYPAGTAMPFKWW